MRHAVLGAGGIGSLLYACLARAGEDVALLVRPSTTGRYPSMLTVKSAALGDFEVPLTVADSLAGPVDVVWVAVKNTQLDDALGSIRVRDLGQGLVIPLLNGIDHYDRLRTFFTADRVAAGTIRVESEITGPGAVAQLSPFAEVNLAGSEDQGGRLTAVAERLTAGGLTCTTSSDPRAILWRKLVLLAPLALSTTAAAAPLGVVRSDPRWHALLEGCVSEACRAASTEGVELAPTSVIAMLDGMPAAMRSSMQKDVEAGRRPELDAIGGAIVRRCRDHGVPSPATSELVGLVEDRLPRGADGAG